MVHQDDQTTFEPVTPSAHRLDPLPIAASMTLIAALSLHEPTHDRLGDGRIPARRRIAQVEEVQTIPSLALLAFLITLYARIGMLPALTALFLYGPLPIVRNTCAGLEAIPQSLHDSAQALGLPRWARLLRASALTQTD